MTGTRLSLDDVPRWAHTVTIRGVDTPLLSPRETEERTVVRPDIGARRRSGLVHGLWRLAVRVLWREPPAPRPPEDQETEALRDLCRAIVPAHHRAVIDALSGGELLDLFMLYRGLQEAHLAGVQAWAAGLASRAMGAGGAPEPAPTGATGAFGGPGLPPATPAGAGVQRVHVPPTRLTPGQPLPSWVGARRNGRVKGG